jgi:hypothetical protein
MELITLRYNKVHARHDRLNPPIHQQVPAQRAIRLPVLPRPATLDLKAEALVQADRPGIVLEDIQTQLAQDRVGLRPLNGRLEQRAADSLTSVLAVYKGLDLAHMAHARKPATLDGHNTCDTVCNMSHHTACIVTLGELHDDPALPADGAYELFALGDEPLVLVEHSLVQL